jgi:hypothetical protein
MSGAEALPFYYDDARNPLGVLASLAAWYTPGNLLGYNWITGLFEFFDLSDPYAKPMLRDADGNVVADFLLNFDAGTIWSLVDDGQDVLFGDEGNDWLVGGTNQDHLWGGDGDDLLQADDNLDSTLVVDDVTYDSLEALTLAYASDTWRARGLIDDLEDARYWEQRGSWYVGKKLDELVRFQNGVLDAIGSLFTADEAAILSRLVQKLLGTSPYANDIADPRSSGVSFADIAFGGPGRDVLVANTTSDRLYDDFEHDDDLFVMPWRGGSSTVVRGPWSHDDDLQLLAWSDGDDGTPLPFVFVNGPGPHDSWWGWPSDGGPTPPAPSAWPWWWGGVWWGTWGYWPDWHDWHDHGAWPWTFGPDVELGLFYCGNHAWDCHGSWHLPHGEIHNGASSDDGVLAFTVLSTPTGFEERVDSLHLDSIQRALLERVVIRGQLTPAEIASLSYGEQIALARLVQRGLITSTTGAPTATDLTWLLIGLADPPRITWKSAGSSTPTTTVTLQGTGDVGDTVSIYDGGTVVATGVVGADGTWTIVVLLTTTGTHYLVARQTVNEVPHRGLTSDASNGVTVVVYPDAPRIVGNSTPAVTTWWTPVTVSGTGDPGDDVTLYDGSHRIATTTVAADGTWAVTVNLSVGEHDLAATQTAPGRLTSDLGDTWTLRVYAPPSAPSISVGSRPTPLLTVGGRGIAGGTVSVYEGGTLLGTAVVGAGGSWSLALTLGIGSHTLIAKQTVQFEPGIVGTSGGDSTSFTVYPTAPAILASTLPAVTTSSAAVTVSGTGDPGDSVTLYDGSRSVGTTTVAGDGTWSLTVNLGVGGHALSATQTAPGRLTSDRSDARGVTVYAPPAAPSISAGGSRQTTQVTLTGTGVPGATVTVTEGTATWTTTVAANGAWTLTVTRPIGAHTLTARQTVQFEPGIVGTSGSASTSFTVYPDAPTLAAPAIATTATSVTVSGTGAAGSTIALYDGSTKIATLTVAADGTWSYTATFAAGTHAFTATQTTSGATSDRSTAATLAVYAPPPAPTVSTPTTQSGTLTLGGSGVAGDTIVVTEGAASWTTTVAANGRWSLALDGLAFGSHTFALRQVEPNTGQKSGTVSTTVNLVDAPAPPSITVSAPGHGFYATVTVSGTGSAGETITLYDGSSAVKTVTVGASGTWSTSVGLWYGGHSLSATRTVAGVTSEHGPAFSVVVGF